MVLATKVGRRRSFGVGLLLTIVTFGVYAVYWNYKAHNELYRQFELARENRDEGMVWYVLGLVLAPFLVAYLWVFASNVAYLRERIGLRRATTPGRLLAIVGIAVGAVAAGLVGSEVAVQTSGEEALEPAIAVLLALALGAAVMLGFGYFLLQRDINEVWAAYDARIGYLALHPEAFRTPEMAELPPVAFGEALASPLRREVEALRAKQPHLRALGELDALLARAEAGDAEAREQGERLLGDVAGLLQERAELATMDTDDARARLEVIESALFQAPP